ncbi:glutathione S-transferase T2-like [Salvia hispanica]|uniref:glutathione S-transferase T2-like n=1 Tax=Salvia hispanica TaxID=49212 RepID=UPI002009449E|nr:glutathione S-transferase T2-like [Salvia hispanica]XP_047966007.1 glutathione S-transferase T2-like [Salvia hispanica]
MDDDENNIFSDSPNFYPSQNYNPSQNFNPSQDYFPSFDDFPNSDQFQNSFQNQHSSQVISPTNLSASNTPHDWSEQEDMSLMSAYCFVSRDAVVGTNQTNAHLWQKVLDQYEEARKENPGMGQQRSLESLRQRYKRLNTNVTKWIGAYKKAHDRATSGQSKEDIEKTAQQLYGKRKFTHHKVFEEVMRYNPKWELKLNSTGSTRFQPDEDSLEESRGSSKRSRTSEEGGPQIDSIPESRSSTLQRPTGRDQAKSKAKRRGKEVATSSYTIPNDFTAALREMRVTRERECDIQERKIKAASDIQERNIKAAILTPLMARRDLTPEEETLKRNLIAELFGN